MKRTRYDVRMMQPMDAANQLPVHVPTCGIHGATVLTARLYEAKYMNAC